MNAIGGVSGAQLAQKSVQSAQSLGVVDKVQDQQKIEGQAAVGLMDDAKAVQGAKEPGKGAQVDIKV